MTTVNQSMNRPLHPAALLRLYTRGVVLFEEQVRPVKFVVDGRDGTLVFPIEIGALAGGMVVLCMPDETQHAMQLLLSTSAIEDWRAQEVCDRWQAYHGRPDRSTWCRGAIESAKFMDGMVDERFLASPNPLVDVEPKLCKAMNADRERLRRVVAAVTQQACSGALTVGVDAWGMDVRLEFGVQRIPFASPAMSKEEADAALDGLLKLGDGGA